MNGWIVVVRIRLLSSQGYAESSPFAVAVKDPHRAIQLVRQAFPLKHGVEIAAIEPYQRETWPSSGCRKANFELDGKR